MAKHKKANEKGILFIIIAVVIFLLRYIPFYKDWGQQRSLDSMMTVCSSLLGAVVKYCDWVKPLNIILIIASIAALLYGIYILYKNR